MSKPSSSSWVGAPPVTAEGFAYAEGVFFAEASGQNRHSRASHHELKTHFTSSGSERDHPAHWFEAQLIHYGLKPSKNKAVARTRLLDALNAGSLTVPPSIAKLEGDLKKEWTKLNREAKKGSQTAGKSTTTTAAGEKKKTASAPEPGPQKSKSKPVISPKKAANDKKNNTAKQSSARAATSAKNAFAASKPPVKKQTARCIRGGRSGSQSRIIVTKSPSPPPSQPRVKQTARRSNAFMARGRIPAPDHVKYENQDSDGDDYMPDAPPPHSDKYGQEGVVNLEPLGLINGSYEVDCPYVLSEWPNFYDYDFDLTLTLAGRKLWGSFSLGVIEGVMYFPERPWKSSTEPIPFLWRGQEDNGPIHYGDQNRGFIRFLGDGRVEGWVDYMSIDFTADRLPNQGTRSDVDAATLNREWEDYSEERYERENRARWH